jgi:hypothetical protein
MNVYVVLCIFLKKLLTRPCFRSYIHGGKEREREKIKEGGSCPPMGWIETRVRMSFDDDDPCNY